MINFRKLNRIAAQLEQELGLNDAGDELLDEAEQEVAQESTPVQESIDDDIEKEKQNTEVPVSSLEADDESSKQLISEADALEQELNDMDDDAPAEAPAEAPAPAPVEEAHAEPGEPTADQLKACVASMHKLLKIAKTVKMSKDLPACKKAEVLGKIQKATEKFRKAGAFGGDDDNATPEKLTNTNSRQKTKDDAAGKFIQFVMSNRAALTRLLNGGAKSQPISSVLGSNVMGISTPAGKLTPLQLIHIFKVLLSQQ